MEEKIQSITAVRKNLMKLSRAAAQSMSRIVLTNRGQEESILLGMSDYRGLKAAAELAAHPRVMEAMRRSQEEIAAGRGVLLEDAFEEAEGAELPLRAAGAGS